MTVSIEEGRQNLLILADFLETLPPNRFNYNTWVGTDWKGAKDLSCGTTACAFGWATTIPKFQQLGLRLVKNSVGVPFVVLGEVVGDDVDWRNSFAAAREVFAIDEDDVEFLFIPSDEDDDCLDEDGLDEEGKPNGNASAKQVAAHIRRFVENGNPIVD